VLEILKDARVTVRPEDGSTRTTSPTVAVRSDMQLTAIPARRTPNSPDLSHVAAQS